MHDPYISVYMPIAGWKAIKYWFNTEDVPPNQGFWEPYETSGFAFKTKAEAVEYAKAWAKDEGLEFIDNEPDKTEDAPDKTVAEQLQEIFPNMEHYEL